MGGNAFGNFRAGGLHWDTLGRQREAMDLITFVLGITTGTAKGKLKGKLGGNMLGRQRVATGGNGFRNFRAGNHQWDS